MDNNIINNSLKCQICYQFYSFDRQPMVLICGHSLCTICLKKIYQSNTSICPFDKKPLLYDDLENIPVNYSLKDLIQVLIKIGVVTDCNFDNFTNFNQENNKQITFEKVSKVENILELIKEDYSNYKEIKKDYDKYFSSQVKRTQKRPVKRFYEDGGFYLGAMEQDRKNGYGVNYNTKSKILYEGYFHENLKHGVGIEINFLK